MGRVSGKMPYVIWYGPFYLLSGVAAFSGAGDLAAGAVWRAVTGAVWLAAAVAAAVATARSQARCRRACDAALRRELMALVRDRARAEGDGAWLNRDAHLAFSAMVTGRGLFRRWTVARIDEDQAPAIAGALDGARTAVTAEFFSVLRGHPAVQREVHGSVVTVTADGETAIEDGPRPGGGLRWWRLRLAAFRDGHLFASAEELRELIGQFREAELITPDGLA